MVIDLVADFADRSGPDIFPVKTQREITLNKLNFTWMNLMGCSRGKVLPDCFGAVSTWNFPNVTDASLCRLATSSHYDDRDLLPPRSNILFFPCFPHLYLDLLLFRLSIRRSPRTKSPTTQLCRYFGNSVRVHTALLRPISQPSSRRQQKQTNRDGESRSVYLI